MLVFYVRSDSDKAHDCRSSPASATPAVTAAHLDRFARLDGLGLSVTALRVFLDRAALSVRSPSPTTCVAGVADRVGGMTRCSGGGARAGAPPDQRHPAVEIGLCVYPFIAAYRDPGKTAMPGSSTPSATASPPASTSRPNSDEPYRRGDDILARFTHPRVSNGPIAPTNGRLEHLLGIALSSAI
jgi:hypothetical protein